MLNVIFGRENVNKPYILDTRIYFRKHSKEFKFKVPFIEEFLRVIDGSEVIAEGALKDFKGDFISVDCMSTGCKTLCSIYYDKDNTIFYGSAMGNNCVPFLMQMARKRDITIFLEHYMDIPSKYFEDGIIYMNNKKLGEYDFDHAYSDWCASQKEE